MTDSILQLSLAVAPALFVGAVMNRVTLPWEKEKRPSERAELLRLLAKDVMRVKHIMAQNMHSLNCGNQKNLSPITFYHWNRLKKDSRLYKYANEPIFKQMIHQFNEWEQFKHAH